MCKFYYWFLFAPQPQKFHIRGTESYDFVPRVVLSGVKRPAITNHIRNIIASQELEEFSVCSILEHMGNDGISSGV